MKDTKPRRLPTRVLRKPDVLALIGVSATTLWRMGRRGDFPRPFRISPGLGRLGRGGSQSLDRGTTPPLQDQVAGYLPDPHKSGNVANS